MGIFQDWPVRYKLVLPLVLIMALGGVAILFVFSNVVEKVTREELPEERALGELRQATLQLLAEYRESILEPSDSTLGEIEELKAEIGLIVREYGPLAESDRVHGSSDHGTYAANIGDAVAELIREGDRALDIRLALATRYRSEELLEEPFEGGRGAATDQPDGARVSSGLTAKYLSMNREFALTHDEELLSKIKNIEGKLKELLEILPRGPSLGTGATASGADERARIRAVLEAGRNISSLSDNLEDALEGLEKSEQDLLEILGELSAIIASDTDDAFKLGLLEVAVLIVAVLTLAGLFGYLMSRNIARRVADLALAASQFGAGELSARVAISETDEIGKLASSFNDMAENLQTNVERRRTAEEGLKALNEELEQRVRDRTAELRAAQDELLRSERLAALGQVTATVSHELRNPLATISASLFTVEEAARDKGVGVERAIERIKRNIDRCDRIIDDLLDYTRMRELDLTPAQIDSWVGRVLSEYALPAGIELERDLRSRAVLHVDSSRLRQVLTNLLDNSSQAIADAAHARGVILVTTRIHDGRLEIAVEDSGPGVPADILPKIFEPLFSTKPFGVGLGLPLVKQIMEQHGGGVEVSNREGGGARTLLWFDLGEQAKELAS